jgi:hypothetical protein
MLNSVRKIIHEIFGLVTLNVFMEQEITLALLYI